MDALFQWFSEPSGLMGAFQLLLDCALILALGLFALSGKRAKRLPAGTEAITASLEKVIEETQSIAGNFDANLQERQILIQQLLVKLDQRIGEAQQLCRQLEGLKQESRVHPAPVMGNGAAQSDHQKVLQLARQGLQAEAIAKRLQKPVGEVELILNLQRLSSAK